MTDRGDRHRRAARLHKEAATRHEEAAQFWIGKGDVARADIEARHARHEQEAAGLETDHAGIEDAERLS